MELALSILVQRRNGGLADLDLAWKSVGFLCRDVESAMGGEMRHQ